MDGYDYRVYLLHMSKIPINRKNNNPIGGNINTDIANGNDNKIIQVCIILSIIVGS